MAVNRYDQDEKVEKFKLSNIKKAWNYAKPYKGKLILSFLVCTTGSILFSFLPKLIQYAIDHTIPAKDGKELLLLTAMAILIIVIDTLLGVVQGRLLNKVTKYVSYDLKNDLFRHLQVLPASYYETRPHGKIFTRVTNYADHVAYVLCNDIFATLLQIVNLVIVLGFMLVLHVPLTLFVLGGVFAFLLLMIYVTPIRRRHQININHKNANVTAYMAESFQGIAITQAFTREEKNLEIDQQLEEKRCKSIQKMLPIASIGWSVSGGAEAIFTVLIYVLGFYFYYPAISIGTIIALGSYASQFWGPISSITNILNNCLDASTYLEQIFDLLEEPVAIQSDEFAQKVSLDGSVIFDHVSYSYLPGNPVLEDLSFSILPKQSVAFVGQTGSGKSTIISLIARYYDTKKGNIYLDHIPIQKIDLASLRSQVNVMLQDNYVFSLSILDNLRYGKKDATKEDVIQICKHLHIHDWIMGLKDNYDTILHGNGRDISTGQRQLLCFARTMIADPKIIILDEATSNVDIKTEKDVLKSLSLLLQNRTSIIIAHRLSTIVHCDQIFFLKDHRIWEQGTHDELMKKKGEYFRLYTAQSGQ